MQTLLPMNERQIYERPEEEVLPLTDSAEYRQGPGVRLFQLTMGRHWATNYKLRCSMWKIAQYLCYISHVERHSTKSNSTGAPEPPKLDIEATNEAFK